MTDPVRVGILSTAHVHTEAYAELLSAFDDVEFVGIADDDADAATELAAAYGTECRPTDELLNDAHGVVVCSPNATHERWVAEAADAGVDVLCEKPLAPTYDQARSIADTCEDAGINAGLVMPLRFSPLAREAKTRFDEGAVGDLRFVTGTNRGKMPGGWFVDPDLAGGGAIMDHTVHILNLVRWITDEEVETVYAESGTRFHDIPVDDVNVLSMTLSDGTPFTLDGSWSRPDEWDTWGDATLELLGTEGVVSMDSTEQAIKHTRDTGDDPGIRSVAFGGDFNRGSLRNFVDAIRDDEHPLSTMEDGAREAAVVEAAYESAESGAVVDVEY
ncbi:Gfo/Idh/MocA family protein [Halorussus amylolyticus]|uniref:Gfo/Idh/MocA family protein n=1 Tax=Halorussus amylolyticus TaxID=1126242 RepID=UPI00104B67D9|nr:Gfo/Idh/MocA family oxidoreductase [Halorussus amylolyticus]